jgi:hypothetical protein
VVLLALALFKFIPHPNTATPSDVTHVFSDDVTQYPLYVTPDDHAVLLAAQGKNLTDVIDFVSSFAYTPSFCTWGFPDYWQLPWQTLYQRAGICRDTAALEASMLLDLGYNAWVVVGDYGKPAAGNGHLWVMCDGKFIESLVNASQQQNVNWTEYFPALRFNNEEVQKWPNLEIYRVPDLSVTEKFCVPFMVFPSPYNPDPVTYITIRNGGSSTIHIVKIFIVGNNQTIAFTPSVAIIPVDCSAVISIANPTPSSATIIIETTRANYTQNGVDGWWHPTP